jgi:hypothetical protein
MRATRKKQANSQKPYTLPISAKLGQQRLIRTLITLACLTVLPLCDAPKSGVPRYPRNNLMQIFWSGHSTGEACLPLQPGSLILCSARRRPPYDTVAPWIGSWR